MGRYLGIVLGIGLLLAACQRPAPAAAPPQAAPPAAAPSAAAAPENSEIARLLAAAREAGETELNVSWGGNSLGGHEAISRYEALFNRMYGTNIKINLTPGPSEPDMAAKITQELAAGQKASSDVYLGGEANIAILLKQEVLEAHDYTRLSPRIASDIVALDRVAVEVYSSIPAIVYNSELVPTAQVPKTLEDVLDPRWKGRIASPPYGSPLDRVALRPEWGAERMKAFAARLAEHAGGMIRSSEESRIVSGEFLMFVMGNTHGAREVQRKGAPIGHAIPPDGAVAGFGHLGVPRNSARPNLGKLFINVVASEEGQRVLWDTYAADHHKLPGSGSAPAVAELQSKGSGIFDINVKLWMERPDNAQLRVELDRIVTRGRAN
jgi:iron(III) transport system substrate-binding protein